MSVAVPPVSLVGLLIQGMNSYENMFSMNSEVGICFSTLNKFILVRFRAICFHVNCAGKVYMWLIVFLGEAIAISSATHLLSIETADYLISIETTDYIILNNVISVLFGWILLSLKPSIGLLAETVDFGPCPDLNGEDSGKGTGSNDWNFIGNIPIDVLNFWCQNNIGEIKRHCH